MHLSSYPGKFMHRNLLAFTRRTYLPLFSLVLKPPVRKAHIALRIRVGKRNFRCSQERQSVQFCEPFEKTGFIDVRSDLALKLRLLALALAPIRDRKGALSLTAKVQ